MSAKLLAGRLAHPHRAHLGDSGHLAHGLLDLAVEAGGRAVHQHVHVLRGQPHRRHQHHAGHRQRRHRVAAGIAGRHQQQADDHRGGAGEVGREVPRARDQGGVVLAGGRCEARRWRGRRRPPAPHPSARTRTSAPARHPRRSAAASPPRSRSRSRRPPAAAPPTAPPGAGPCRARTGAWRRAAARPRPPRTPTAAPRPRRGRNGRPRPEFRGSRWRCRRQAW